MAKQQQSKRQLAPQKIAVKASVPVNWSWLLPVVAAAALYLFGLGNEMTGVDDHTATVDNPMVKDFSLPTLVSNFNLGMYAPLTWLMYGIAFGIGGKSAVVYHLFSLLAHCGCTYLVYRFMARLLESPATGVAVAFIFAVHPLQVEAVAWIAGFSTPLFALFFLLSLLKYLDYRDAAPGQGTRSYLLSLLLFVAACLAKSAAVTLPLALMVVELWKTSRTGLLSRWLKLVPWFVIALGFGVLTVFSRVQSGMNVSITSEVTPFERVIILGYTPIFYWIKMLFPFKLNIYYAFKQGNGQLPMVAYTGWPILAVVGYFAWKLRHSAPYIGWGLLFFFANLLVMMPFASMGTFELIADHYNYLPIIGIAVLLVKVWEALKNRYPASTGAISAIGYGWVAMLVILTFMQIRIWKDTISVISNAINNGYYQNGLMFFSRGLEYGDLGKMPLAIEDFNRAIEINPNLKDAYKFRGSLLGQAGKHQEALRDLEKYTALDPKDIVVLHNLGMTYAQMGQPQKAIEAFSRCIEIKPNVSDLYVKRAQQYEVLGDATRAQADRTKAQQLKTKN